MADKPRADTGIVLQLQSFSLHDGDGIRTVVFLAGCPLRCAWCANPESWSLEPKLAHYKDKCLYCGACRTSCPHGLFPAGRERRGCDACGLCVRNCPARALKILCQPMSVTQAVKKIRREELFYRYSGGGVTFSGGEPTYQHAFLRSLSVSLAAAGVDMWIETSGCFSWEIAGDIFSYFSHVFLDLKVFSPQDHRVFTGQGNELILSNAVKIREAGLPLTIRVPCVKGANFTEKNLTDTALFLRERLPEVEVELLPYHALGKEKYLAVGLEEFWQEYAAPERDELEKAREIFRRAGMRTVSYA
jgi:pyruvate formate lyase activating enzyme